MKTEDAIAIRYTGPDHKRTYIIQRGDGKFWTGRNWSNKLSDAENFTSHKTAQAAVSAIQYERWKGRPVKVFKAEIIFTVVGDEPVSEEEMKDWVAEAVRIDVETTQHGDGPRDNYMIARLNLKSLEKGRSDRKVF